MSAMTTRALRRAIPPLLAAAILVGTSPPLVSQSTEEFARRQYQSGLAFLQEKNYVEALKDFQAVVDQYSSSSVADLALLQIALYQLDVAHDPEAASAPAEMILKKYPTGEAAPTAHVLAGRILLARGRDVDLDGALASFERVRRLFPGTDAVPAAMFHAAEALRAFHREDEALVLYRQVATDHARSSQAPRALLGEGYCLLHEGRSIPAMEQWQRVRQRYAGSPEAQTALAWNTIAYRLYLRVPGQPAFAFTNRVLPAAPGKLKDATGAAVGTGDVLLVALRNGVAAFDPKGAPAPVPGGGPSRAITASRDGRIWFVQRGALTPSGGSPVAIAIPKPDGTLRVLEDIPAAVVTSFGEALVADKDTKTIARFDLAGKYLGIFAQIDASRLAINGVDDVAVLNRDDKSVSLFDRSGKLAKRLVAKGQGYVFGTPTDVAFDSLGHLFVLDRGASAFYVFSAAGALVTYVTVPERAPGALRHGTALAIDSAGRLFVYDDDLERMLVYQ